MKNGKSKNRKEKIWEKHIFFFDFRFESESLKMNEKKKTIVCCFLISFIGTLECREFFFSFFFHFILFFIALTHKNEVQFYLKSDWKFTTMNDKRHHRSAWMKQSHFNSHFEWIFIFYLWQVCYIFFFFSQHFFVYFWMKFEKIVCALSVKEKKKISKNMIYKNCLSLMWMRLSEWSEIDIECKKRKKNEKKEKFVSCAI